MKVINSSFSFNDVVNGSDILKKIEKAARVCYKSEDKMVSGILFSAIAIC